MTPRKEFARHSRPVLKTRRWQVLRQIILERDGWACVDCGGRKRLEIDHVQPVRTRPDLAFDPANLATRCAPCHTKKPVSNAATPHRSEAPSVTHGAKPLPIWQR